jgi:hypothetical protein
MEWRLLFDWQIEVPKRALPVEDEGVGETFKNNEKIIDE